MSRLTLSLGFLVLVVASATAQTAVPERIVLNLTAAPATSVAVTWRTNTEVKTPLVQVALATAEAKLADTARTVSARTELLAMPEAKPAWQHSAVTADLQPATLYAYRVGDGTTWSEWNQFKTANSGVAPFRFLYFGDVQNDVKEYCSRTFRTAFAKAPDAAFFLMVGDLVTTTASEDMWAEFFSALDPFERLTPSASAVGNHEYREFEVEGRNVRTASPLFRAQFTQPTNGPAGLAETAFTFDYQGARFVVLNGNERLAEQAAWLDGLLGANRNRWTIVVMHQPIYSTGKTRDSAKARDVFLPLYEKHGVDLVLQGHDHTYARSFKLQGGQRVADDAPGTVYVVSFAGPKSYPVNPRYAQLMAKLDTGRQLFQVIAVERDVLRFEAWTVTGELYDSFTLTKKVATEGRR